jgi:hypothetical protein
MMANNYFCSTHFLSLGRETTSFLETSLEVD